MKEEGKKEITIVDLVLDGELSEEHLQALMGVIESDEALKKDLLAKSRVVERLRAQERLQAPVFFTDNVMKGLPQARPGLVERIGYFLFKGRLLRWNMATAAAVLCLVMFMIIFTSKQWVGKRDQTASHVPLITVTMHLYAPKARNVAVAGTFNKWRTDTDLLRRGTDGVWSISIPLPPGEYSYMFVIDGTAWQTDPDAESYRDDGFGDKNAVLRVKI